MMEVRVECDWSGNCFLSRSMFRAKHPGSWNKMDMDTVCRCRIAGMYRSQTCFLPRKQTLFRFHVSFTVAIENFESTEKANKRFGPETVLEINGLARI